VRDFEAAIRARTGLADAEASAGSVCGWLATMQSDPDSIRSYAQVARRHVKRSIELEPRNPRGRRPTIPSPPIGAAPKP
jgi:hypothetical protein